MKNTKYEESPCSVLCSDVNVTKKHESGRRLLKVDLGKVVQEGRPNNIVFDLTGEKTTNDDYTLFLYFAQNMHRVFVSECVITLLHKAPPDAPP